MELREMSHTIQTTCTCALDQIRGKGQRSPHGLKTATQVSTESLVTLEAPPVETRP